MSNRPEPDDVDLFVGGVEPDARSAIETARFIEEYKKCLDYPLEAEEAKRILAALGINDSECGIPGAKSLAEHWHGRVAELLETNLGRTNGAGVNQEDIGVGSSIPGAKPT
jgi:hypothetical protein